MHVLIGNCDPVMTKCIAHLVYKAIEGKYVLKVTSTYYAKELLEHAQNHTFDLFILVLNNIVFPSGNLPPGLRIARSVQLITHFRIFYQKPVITLAGDPSLEEKAKIAGAAFFFPLPFNPREFMDAVSQLLDKGEGEKTKEDLDKTFRKIDESLEEAAGEFVKNYIQKPGTDGNRLHIPDRDDFRDENT